MKTYKNIIGSLKVKVMLGLLVLAPLSSMANPCGGALPDLRVRALITTKQFTCNVLNLDRVFYGVTIENLGATTTGKFYVEVRSQVQTSRWLIHGLKSGEIRTINSYMKAPKQKTVTLTALVDPNNVIRESNKGNNSRSASFRNNCR